MPFLVWYLVVGALLVLMALAGTVLKRLPLTASLVYLGAGVALGPAGLGLLRLNPLAGGALVEHLTEVAVIVSLFTAGLKLRVPPRDRRWLLPVRLASVSMVVTIGLIALAGVYGLGLPWGAAVLLGAVLAPTDPVLASDVQVREPQDRDHLRFALTGEAGLNDGTAFPFVMLGLGLLGLHDLGDGGLRWLAVDVGWRTAAGLAVGAACGVAVGRLVVYLRRTHHEALGTDAFLTLGLIALAYGVAEAAHGWGFLAVFAAGLALRYVEHTASAAEGVPDEAPPASEVADADDPEALAAAEPYIPQLMARAVLGFNEQIERILEVAVVLLVGALLLAVPFDPAALWFVPLLLLVIRPLAVRVGLAGAPVSRVQRALAGWFGIRGIGSVYYLAFALTAGVEGPLAVRLLSLVLWTVAVSAVVHGVSVTPLMAWYRARTERAGERSG